MVKLSNVLVSSIYRNTIRLLYHSKFGEKVIYYMIDISPSQSVLISYMMSLLPEAIDEIYNTTLAGGAGMKVLHDRLAKAMNKYGRRDVLAEVKNIISDTIHGVIIDTDFDREYPYTNFVYYLAYTNGVHTRIIEHVETGILRIEANPHLDDRFLTQLQNRRDPYFKFHKTDIAAHMRYLEKIPRKQRFIPEGFRTFEEYDEHNAAIAFGEMFSKIDKMDKIWSKYQTPQLTVECATCASNIIESDIITDAEKQILVINHPEYKDRYPICRNCYRSIFLPQSECRGACKRIRAHHDALINDPERLRSSFIIGMARGVIGLRKYLVDFIPKNEIDAMTDDEIVEFAENM